MAATGPSSSSLKTLNTIITTTPPGLPTKPSSSPSMKLKTLLQTLFFSHMYRIARALHKVKALLLHLFKDIDLLHLMRRNKKKNKKLIFGSFRLYYNWCSSQAGYGTSNLCYDYTAGWNKNSSHVISRRFDYDEFHEYSGSSELSRYLQWLEEKASCSTTHEELLDSSNEIDRLADLFIANCHEKFRLEKQESYRMFQEMMARSV